MSAERPTPQEINENDFWGGHGFDDDCPTKRSLSSLPGINVVDFLLKAPDGLRRGQEIQAAYNAISHLRKRQRLPLYKLISGMQFNLENMGRGTYIKFHQDESSEPGILLQNTYYGIVTREGRELIAFTEDSLDEDFMTALKIGMTVLRRPVYTIGETKHYKIGKSNVLRRINSLEVLAKAPPKRRRVTKKQAVQKGKLQMGQINI